MDEILKCVIIQIKATVQHVLAVIINTLLFAVKNNTLYEGVPNFERKRFFAPEMSSVFYLFF